MEKSRRCELKHQARVSTSESDYQLNEGGMPRLASTLGLSQSITDVEYLKAVQLFAAEALFPLEDALRMGMHDRGPEGDSLLHVACGWGDLRAVRLLVEAGAEIDAKDDMGCMPLHVATNGRYLDIIEFLVNRGATTSTKDAFGYSPLEWALHMGYTEVADVLRGANPSFKRDALKRAP